MNRLQYGAFMVYAPPGGRACGYGSDVAEQGRERCNNAVIVYGSVCKRLLG